MPDVTNLHRLADLTAPNNDPIDPEDVEEAMREAFHALPDFLSLLDAAREVVAADGYQVVPSMRHALDRLASVIASLEEK